MNAGRLNRSISIERRVVEQEAAYGTQSVGWSRLCACRAEVLDLIPSRSEAVRQGLEQARNLTRIRIRHRGDIDSTMRVIVHGGGQDVIYQIVGGPAEIGGRRRMLELVCERYSTAGGA
ncbi:MAG: phage head closure protein [Phycisphaerales bacterium]|nr:phage head closure protein [Phycisphaerales bacterium]